MKVYLGKYKSYFGIYHLVELTKYIGVSEKTREKITGKLYGGTLSNLLDWIHKKRERVEYIHIDRHDTFSAYSNIAAITMPLLQEFNKYRNGAPVVDIDDVPDELKVQVFSDPADHCDDNFFKRWDWVINEIIWTMEQLVNEDDIHIVLQHEDGYDDFLQNQLRMDNGLRLFGKYFRNLWW